jgi:gamma-glutamyltranspeptidase/glutathione hydrolase
MTKPAMIVAAQPEAAEAGARVLMDGGNAVDAAITAGLVQGVVDPQMCGIAGFGSCQIYMPSADTHVSIDFHGKAPLAATPEMWADLVEGETRDGFGFIVRDNVNDMGYQSITTPGSLMAYWEAVERLGSWSWADVCRPAIEHASDGIVLRPRTVAWWQMTAEQQLGRAANEARLALTEDGRTIYFDDDGRLLRPGQRLRNPDMARTLERVAAGGADVFYRGEIADEIDADMRANDGLLSKADLAAYKTTWAEPLWTDYRDVRIATNHPPGGGVQVIEMLNILEHLDLAALGHNSAGYIRVVSEAMKRATRDKDEFVGDPAFTDVPLEWLTSKSYAAELAEEIGRGERASVQRVGGEPPDTTHVVVVDREGNIVTMTHSLGSPSGVISPGLGFMFNGCMGVFDPRPGRAGSIAPGKSRFSSLCPTIVFRGDQPYVALGAPGGTQISMGVTQAILNVVDHKMTMLEAVSAPRFSSTSNAIDVMNRIPRYVTDELETDGYEVIRSPQSFGIAAVHGIRIQDGKLDGGADPGLDGVALSV